MSKKKESPPPMEDESSLAMLELHRNVQALFACYGLRLAFTEELGEHMVQAEPYSARMLSKQSLGMLEGIQMMLTEINRRRSAR